MKVLPVKIVPPLAAVCLWLLTLTGAQAQPATRPNILLIFADDLGWRDVGYQGSDFYETPNIDRLAREGMVFTQAYAGGGNCQPSRACLVSGNYTPRHGVYAVDSTERGPKRLMRLQPVPNRSGLAASQVTIAEALKSAGYTTALFGKWHLGGPEGASPTEQGFDVFLDTYNTRARNTPNGDRPNPPPPDPKAVYSLTAAAEKFIAQHRDKPFFVFLSHHAIHSPLEARPATLAKFRSKLRGTQHHEPLYAACLYDFDHAVGTILQKLRDLGLEQNTLVIFTSDNGGTRRSSQEPLRGNKGCYYEGGIREPLIARWPGVIKPGSRCTVPTINLDLYPTFLEVAGMPTPPGKVLDGTSLVPLLRGKESLQRDAIYWHFPGYLDEPVIRGRDNIFRTRPVSVIRKGDWKLHLYHEEWVLDGGMAALDQSNAVELYNLRLDVGERMNVAGSAQAERDELLRDLLAWMRDIDAPLPARRERPAMDTSVQQ